MTSVDKQTVALLQELYIITHMQADLAKEERSLVINWSGLRLRLEDALIRNGVSIPDRPEIGAAKEKP